MNYTIIDYETYYDSEYSLGKMPTAQYVRDPRFQALGVGVKTAAMAEPAWTPSISHAERSLIPQPPDVLVAHNAQFDGLVRETHTTGMRPRLYVDTKLLARWHIAQGTLPPDLYTGLADLAAHYGLPAKGDTAGAVAAGGEELAEYCKHDVWLTEQLLHKLLPGVPAAELWAMDLHVRMAVEPQFAQDPQLLHDEIEAVRVPEDIKKAVGSNERFAQALRGVGVEPGTKTSPTTGQAAYAFAKTDDFMQNLQVHPDPRVRKLAELRLAAKSTIGSSRAQRLLDVGAPVPVPLLYYGAHTGRSSGLDKLNMQNLPAGGRIRRSLQAPPGYKLVICDSGQVEVRVLAWLAGEQRLLDVCRAFDAGQGPDVYVDFAGNVMFPKDPAEVTGDERKKSKPPVLAAGFGQGWRGLIAYAAGMGITLTEAQSQRAVDGYRRRFPAIVRYWDELMGRVRNEGELVLPNGRKLVYPDRYWHGRDLWFQRHAIFSKGRKGYRQEVKLWHGLLAENITQGTARDVVFAQTRQLAADYRVLLMAHDESVFLVPEDQAEQCKKDAEAAFSTTPAGYEGMPLVGEAIISDDYGAKP